MRLIVVVAGLAAAIAAMGATATSGAPQTSGSKRLTGTWAGVLSGTVNGTVRHERIRLVVNARQNGGSWRVSASCHGRLTLDSISGGSHHYRRHLAAGATCAGGDVDCLWREGAEVYDNITPRTGGWSRDGTLRRVRG